MYRICVIYCHKLKAKAILFYKPWITSTNTVDDIHCGSITGDTNNGFLVKFSNDVMSQVYFVQIKPFNLSQRCEFYFVNCSHYVLFKLFGTAPFD